MNDRLNTTVDYDALVKRLSAVLAPPRVEHHNGVWLEVHHTGNLQHPVAKEAQDAIEQLRRELAEAEHERDHAAENRWQNMNTAVKAIEERDALAARVKVLEGLVKGAAGAADRDSYYFPENWEEHAEAYFKGVTA